jgi:23S rRNA (cytosine1962-C5)-methyltransferase
MISLIQNQSQTPIRLQLSRDLTRAIKRGHAWVYREALRHLPQVTPGTKAILLDNRGGKEIAQGFYDPESSIALRICSTQVVEPLNDKWVRKTMAQALGLRKLLFDDKTTGYRLFHGEGDGLPGLVCDIYVKSAVIKFDGQAAEHFWDARGICDWLHTNLGIQSVYLKQKKREGEGKLIFGETLEQPVSFLENGITFSADLIHGQKTGFFFDQRDNRMRIKQLTADKNVLNAFGYTGGFSVYAGLGGASHVTTVDLAKPALEAADCHWASNNLNPLAHESIATDVFDYLESAVKETRRWDLVILDPPSFAQSESSLPRALKAYTKLITLGIAVTQTNGILATSSCSSHVTEEQFIKVCEDGVSQAKRKATLIGRFGLPADHPTPLVMPELRYLKFLLLQLD